MKNETIVRQAYENWMKINRDISERGHKMPIRELCELQEARNGWRQTVLNAQRVS